MIVLFTEKWDLVGSYGYMSGPGFATVGSLDKELPAGKYNLYIINQEAKTKKLRISMNFYWMK